jgi:hypothetical protein
MVTTASHPAQSRTNVWSRLSLDLSVMVSGAARANVNGDGF